MKIMQKSRLGFTLIELLIVVVIIGILSVAFLPTVLNAPKKARDNQRKAHISAIVQAIQNYYSDQGVLGTATSTTIDPAITKTFPNNALPKDPTGVDYLFKYLYASATENCFIVMTRVAMDIPANGNVVEVTDANTTFNALSCTNSPAPVASTVAKSYYATILRMN